MRAWRALALALWASAALGEGEPSAVEAPPPARVRVGLVDALPPRPSVDERLDEIRRRIERALVYPPIARMQGVTGEAEVEFEIGHDGRPEAIRVVHSSGHDVLDRAAERSVADAAPLPWVQGRLTVPVAFDLDRRR
jgi:TonB family protein